MGSNPECDGQLARPYRISVVIIVLPLASLKKIWMIADFAQDIDTCQRIASVLRTFRKHEARLQEGVPRFKDLHAACLSCRTMFYTFLLELRWVTVGNVDKHVGLLSHN